MPVYPNLKHVNLMPRRNLESGIQAIKQGNITEGARYLKLALRDERLRGVERAAAYIWLAQTREDPAFKLECYRNALQADPSNQYAQDRIAELNYPELPPAPQPPTRTGDTDPLPHYPQVQQQPPAQTGDTGPLPYYPQVQQQPPTRTGDTGPLPYYPAPPQQPPQMPAQHIEPPRPTDSGPLQPFQPPPQQTDTQAYRQQMYYQNPTSQAAPQPPYSGDTGASSYRTVGISGGPNGEGSGFFVTTDGLIATTRYAVGGLEKVTVELHQGQVIEGKVVRAWPESDIALVRVPTTVRQLLTITAMYPLAERMQITAYAYQKQPIRGLVRRTGRKLAEYWIPTTIARVVDAGGAPLMDDSGYLVGMMTRNMSRSSNHYYGVHITYIYTLVQKYIQEIQYTSNRQYCPHCGFASMVAAYGGFYCENCGGVLPYALNQQRFPQPQLGQLYGEGKYMPCPHCQATIGTYNQLCLRCGRQIGQ